MTKQGIKPNSENSFVIECKKCGMRMTVFSAYYRTMKIKCRNCHGCRFRRVPEMTVDEALANLLGVGEE